MSNDENSLIETIGDITTDLLAGAFVFGARVVKSCVNPTLVAEFENVEISVKKTAFETSLFINNKFITKKKAFIDPLFRKPVIKCTYKFPSGNKSVEVLIGGLNNGGLNKVEIAVNGNVIAEKSAI
jgi:hypothetical protein